jgi:hypothetical protein
MVVGINYSGNPEDGPVRPLKGCINDANDIGRQVARLNPGFFRLLGVKDEPVTRDSFFSTWREMMGAAGEGDTLLLTYSGHGGRVDARCPGTEADDKDETLILSRFQPNQPPDAMEHIIDDELAVLWAEAAAKRLRVVFIADSCFSGTVHRSVDLADRRYRTIRSYRLPPGSRAPVPCQAVSQEEPRNLLFLAGSQENEVVPEITVGADWRGALSVAVARALEGGADANRDGVITGEELTQFVLDYTESLSDAGQHPTVTWHGSRSTVVDLTGESTRSSLIFLGPPPPAGTATKIEPPPQIGPARLQIQGLAAAEQRRVVSTLQNAVLIDDTEAPWLIWDATRGFVLNEQGHRIAEGVDASQLQHAVDRRRMMERVVGMSAGTSLRVRIHLPGEAASAPPSAAADATHRAKSTLIIRVSGVSDGHYMTVFNLTGSGKVQLLEPRPPQDRCIEAACRNGTQKASGVDIKPFEVEVGAPFGADHVVVVAGARRLSRLMPALVSAHNRFGAADVMAALDREAETQSLQAGFRGIYTRDR